jgi:ketosteroid isomerase-like protein
MTPLDVVAELYAAREAGDEATRTRLCHPAMAFTFNADPDQVGDGATLVGSAAIEAHLARVRRHWEELSYAVESLSLVDDGTDRRVRAVIDFTLRKRATALTLTSRKTQIWTVRNGRVTAMEEILRVADVHTLLRLSQVPDAAAGE